MRSEKRTKNQRPEQGPPQLLEIGVALIGYSFSDV